MAGALTQAAANSLLDLATGRTSTAPFTGPVKVRLTTADGTATANGTEVTGGSYASQTGTFTAATTTSSNNSAALVYPSMPACTVVGVELWDSSATPRRLWRGTLSSPVVVAAGATFTIAIGTLTVALTT